MNASPSPAGVAGDAVQAPHVGEITRGRAGAARAV
jgi:hypothetical protein